MFFSFLTIVKYANMRLVSETLIFMPHKLWSTRERERNLQEMCSPLLESYSHCLSPALYSQSSRSSAYISNRKCWNLFAQTIYWMINGWWKWQLWSARSTQRICPSGVRICSHLIEKTIISLSEQTSSWTSSTEVWCMQWHADDHARRVDHHSLCRIHRRTIHLCFQSANSVVNELDWQRLEQIDRSSWEVTFFYFSRINYVHSEISSTQVYIMKLQRKEKYFSPAWRRWIGEGFEVKWSATVTRCSSYLEPISSVTHPCYGFWISTFLSEVQGSFYLCAPSMPIPCSWWSKFPLL